MSGLMSLQKEIALISPSKVQIQDEFNNHHVGSSPLSNVFRRNYTGLTTNAFSLSHFKFVTFNDSAWTYNPALFCNDYYTDASLSPIILLVNNMKSMFDFKASNFSNRLILAPTSDIIYQILANR